MGDRDADTYYFPAGAPFCQVKRASGEITAFMMMRNPAGLGEAMLEKGRAFLRSTRLMLEDTKPPARTSNLPMKFVARELSVPVLAGTASQSSTTLAIADADADEPMEAVSAQTSAADMQMMD